MGRQELTNFVDLNLIEDEWDVMLVHDEIFQFLKDPSYKKKYDEKFANYMEFLYQKGETNGFGICYYKFMGINTNQEIYEPMLTFSYKGLFISLGNMLNCLNEGKLNYDELSTKMDELLNIKTPTELSKKFPFLYIYTASEKEEFTNSVNVYKIIKEYESSKNDPIKLNMLMESYEKDGKNLEILYQKSKMCKDFKHFIVKMSSYFVNILKNRHEIEKWIKEHPIDIKFSKNDIKKLMIYIMERYLITVEEEASQEKTARAQKCLTIFESYLKNYEKEFTNDNTRIEFLRDYNPDFNLNDKKKKVRCVRSLETLKTHYNEILKKYSYLKAGLELPKVDTSLSFDENRKRALDYIVNSLKETINEDKEQGATDVSDEVNKKVAQLEKELSDPNITVENKRLKRLILDKIKMVLKDIEPTAIQTGTGKVFKKYYVYYYPNGMVAIDNIDGYGALYIMPVHLYNAARYKNSLTEVRNIPGVKYISHKNKNWLKIAKTAIENGTEGLTGDDIEKSSKVASMNFPYTIDKLEELEKAFAEEGNEIGVKETKRRIRKTRELEKIDTDLKDNEFNKYEIYPQESRQKVEKFDGGKDELLNEDEINSVVSSDKPFEELYEYWKKNHEKEKNKRNPVVAGITKRRTLDENNRYCCELCRKENYLDPGSLRSHHVIPLSQGGPDTIYNTVGICPNCHDFVHSHYMTIDIQAKLFDIIKHHIEEENPEYLPNFYDMLSSLAKDDEDYMNRKGIIDSNFDIQWKDANIKKR